MTEILWIKDPLAIMADGAGRGVLVQGRWTVIDGTLPDLDPDALRHHHQDAACSFTRTRHALCRKHNEPRLT